MLTLSPAVIDELRDAAPECTTEAPATPERQRTIDQIIRINPTAAVGFLNRFTDGALRTYLDHLEVTSQPRGKSAVWVRPGDTAAVVTRQRND